MAYDILVSVVIGLYILVALFAAFATVSEHERNKMRDALPRLLSALACIGWPLVVAFMVLAQHFAPHFAGHTARRR